MTKTAITKTQPLGNTPWGPATYGTKISCIVTTRHCKLINNYKKDILACLFLVFNTFFTSPKYSVGKKTAVHISKDGRYLILLTMCINL